MAADVARRCPAPVAGDARADAGQSSLDDAGLRALARPWPAWLLFNATLIGWHIPGAYDLTLRSQTVHDLEHAMFFFTGLLFWAHVIEPGPLRSRLSWPTRIWYVVGAMVVSWMLSITLVLVSIRSTRPTPRSCTGPAGSRR